VSREFQVASVDALFARQTKQHTLPGITKQAESPMGAAFADIASLCAPTMAVEQVAAVASVESALARLAIRFNSGGAPKELPRTEDQAVKLAGERIAASEDIDLGLMGVNATLLPGLGLTVRGAFDPCLNIKAGVALLERYRADAVKSGVRGEFVEIEMLERYFGKGDATLGSMSGFAERVRREAAKFKGRPITLEIKDWVPTLPAREFTGDRGAPLAVAASSSSGVADVRRREAASAGPPAPWDVFGRSRMMPGGGFKTGDAR
jgi:type IV secretion system protein VirB1